MECSGVGSGGVVSWGAVSSVRETSFYIMVVLHGHGTCATDPHDVEVGYSTPNTRCSSPVPGSTCLSCESQQFYAGDCYRIKKAVISPHKI